MVLLPVFRQGTCGHRIGCPLLLLHMPPAAETSRGPIAHTFGMRTGEKTAALAKCRFDSSLEARRLRRNLDSGPSSALAMARLGTSVAAEERLRLVTSGLRVTVRPPHGATLSAAIDTPTTECVMLGLAIPPRLGHGTMRPLGQGSRSLGVRTPGQAVGSGSRSHHEQGRGRAPIRAGTRIDSDNGAVEIGPFAGSPRPLSPSDVT